MGETMGSKKHGWEWGMGMSLNPRFCPAHWYLPQHPARAAGRETEAQWGWEGLSQGQGSSREVLECWGAGDPACGGFGSGSRS